MSTIGAGTRRRFYRDVDRAVLGGVCAGLAAYLGFNLKMTRFLAFITFLMAMPIAVIGYLAAVFLIPAESYRDFAVADERDEPPRKRRRCSKHSADTPGPSDAEEIDRRCSTLDERLIRLEKHVTSRRFQLNQELSKL
jgi:phage shock protein C